MAYLAQVTIPAVGGVTADVQTNTWAFSGNLSTPALITEARVALQDFYDDIAALITNSLDRANARIKFYDLDDPEPRQPISDTPFTIAVAFSASSALPAEVAMVLSFRAVLESGSPAARRRGRVYLPTMVTSVSSAGRPSLAARTTVRDAAAALLNTSQASINWSWGVYSRVDGVVRPVVRGHVDDAWDTQRRRGPEASTRISFPS